MVYYDFLAVLKNQSKGESLQAFRGGRLHLGNNAEGGICRGIATAGVALWNN